MVGIVFLCVLLVVDVLEDFVDLCWIDFGVFDCGVYDVVGECWCFGGVEIIMIGFVDGGMGGGDDCGFVYGIGFF